MSTRYTKDHEWARMEGEVALVGVSAHAAELLGGVVYVELPQVGARFAAGAEMAVVESAKAASPVYAPFAGEIVAVNDALASAPEKVNESAEGEAWFVKIKPVEAGAIEALMDAAAYEKFLAS